MIDLAVIKPDGLPDINERGFGSAAIFIRPSNCKPQHYACINVNGDHKQLKYKKQTVTPHLNIGSLYFNKTKNVV